MANKVTVKFDRKDVYKQLRAACAEGMTYSTGREQVRYTKEKTAGCIRLLQKGSHLRLILAYLETLGHLPQSFTKKKQHRKTTLRSKETPCEN